MAYQAVFWDNDGVLVDTERHFFAATRDVLGEIGVTLTEADFLELSLTRGVNMFELARARGFTHDEAEALRDRRNDRYARILAAGVEVNAGVVGALEDLAGSYRMAVVTSSRPDHFEIIHRSTDLLRFFEFALTPDLYGPHKPHPEPYLIAAARMGLPPSRCIAIEDSPRGVESATRAGMRCIGVPHGLSDSRALAGAACVAVDASQIPSIVRELSGGS